MGLLHSKRRHSFFPVRFFHWVLLVRILRRYIIDSNFKSEVSAISCSVRICFTLFPICIYFLVTFPFVDSLYHVGLELLLLFFIFNKMLEIDK